MERPRALQDLQQFPRSRRRKRVVRRRRSVDSRSRAGRHRDSWQSSGQTAPVARGEPGLRGHAVVRQEPLRAEERPAGDRRGQRLRVQLAPVPERVRDSVYGSESGRGRPLVGRGGRDLREQRRPARRVRHQRARPRRHPSESAHRTHCHPEQSLRRCRRPVGWRPPVSASRRHVRHQHRSQHGVFRATRCSLAAITHRTPASCSKTILRSTTATASSGLEPRPAAPRSIATSLARWSAGT